jgi:hypothetical protein
MILGKPWHDKEKEIVRRYYPKQGPKAAWTALRRAGFSRTIRQVRSAAARFGIKYTPPPAVVAKEPELDGTISACWYCSRATALLCPWMARGDRRDLIEYTERWVSVSNPEKRAEGGPTEIQLVKVIRCRRYRHGDPPPIGELQQKIS